jgi:hypothetical protein
MQIPDLAGATSLTRLEVSYNQVGAAVTDIAAQQLPVKRVTAAA